MGKPAKLWYTFFHKEKNVALFRQASCFDSTGAKHHGITFTSNDFGFPRPKSGLLAA